MGIAAAARRTGLPLLALALLVLAAYLPALDNGFIEYHDDTTYVTRNPQVLGGLTPRAVAWALTSFHALNWHPLTWLSHLLDATLFGASPRGHHLVSVLWHLANAGLLLLVVRTLTGSGRLGLAVAALFAAHPANVESVAWISERKNVLSTFFWLLTLAAYARYAARPGARRYLPVAAALALGLMAKPMLVTLPLVLLLLDYWPLGRAAHGRDAATTAGCRLALPLHLLDKIPLLALSAAASVLTWWAQSEGGVVRSWTSFPLALRLENAAVAYVRYLGTLAWPRDLAFLYPHPRHGQPAWQAAGALALLLALTLLAVRLRRSRPWLLVGWLWFAGTLVPVSGLVQVGGAAMADRYAYVPFIGLFLAVARELAQQARARPRGEAVLGAAAAAAVAVLLVATRAQVPVWKDGATLYTHSLAAGGEDWLLRNNLGLILADRGDLEGAKREYARAIELKPDALYPLVNLGAALGRQGRLPEALACFERALRLHPDSVEALDNLGLVLERLGRRGEAAERYREALRRSPGNSQARGNLERIDGRSDRVLASPP